MGTVPGYGNQEKAFFPPLRAYQIGKSPRGMDLSAGPGFLLLCRIRAPENNDGLVKSLLDRHPGKPRIKSGAGAGVQNKLK